MLFVKACAICLSANVKLYKMDNGKLREEYNLVSGLETHKENGLPGYLCVECTAYVRRFKKFREKCHRAHYALKEILYKSKQITKANIEIIDRKLIDVMPTLSYVDHNIMQKWIKFEWVETNHFNNVHDDIPISHHDSSNNKCEIEVPAIKSEQFQKEEDLVKIEITHVMDNRNCNSELLDLTNDSKETDILDKSTLKHSYCGIEELNNGDNLPCKDTKNDYEDVDDSNLHAEYASLIPISMKEAKAATKVYITFSKGKYNCEICKRAFFNESRLINHMRMHDKYVSGTFLCELCNYYYKTDFLLKNHMTEKHKYKYVCRKCPEVSFDRTSAKQHFIWMHLEKRKKTSSTCYQSRPNRLNPKGWKKPNKDLSHCPIRKSKNVPKDFLLYSPISHKEQYEMVQARQRTVKYLRAQFKCVFCFKVFRAVETLNKHMRNHDPALAGKFQCDMCKLYFKDTRKLYKHMYKNHLLKYSCQMCNYICFSRDQAQEHYKWHKNVFYQCPHCHKEFQKASTRLTHIRINHPSTNICSLCGHSFVSEAGLHCHKKIAHTKEEIEACDSSEVDVSDPLYCADCKTQFTNQAAFTTHLQSSNKHTATNRSIKRASRAKGEDGRKRGRPRRDTSEILNTSLPVSTHCKVCNKYLSNDLQARKHYEAEHHGAEFLKRYMCDICGHATKQYGNLMVHMRTHQRKAVRVSALQTKRQRAQLPAAPSHCVDEGQPLSKQCLQTTSKDHASQDTVHVMR